MCQEKKREKNRKTIPSLFLHPFSFYLHTGFLSFWPPSIAWPPAILKEMKLKILRPRIKILIFLYKYYKHKINKKRNDIYQVLEKKRERIKSSKEKKREIKRASMCEWEKT